VRTAQDKAVREHRIGHCFTTSSDRLRDRSFNRDLLNRELSAHAAATALTALSEDDREVRVRNLRFHCVSALLSPPDSWWSSPSFPRSITERRRLITWVIFSAQDLQKLGNFQCASTRSANFRVALVSH